MFLYNGVYLKPTKCAFTGIISHQLPIVGTVNIPLKKEDGSNIDIPFLVSQYGLSVLAFKGPILLDVRISLYTKPSGSTLIRDLVFRV